MASASIQWVTVVDLDEYGGSVMNPALYGYELRLNGS